ncbi:hypothetical protein AC480_02120 [miscellaneous Crenarchaeota group archaeon SMTZ1-55]|nr:MAG: hypothetical protein AC480_02120 [miscellaneous Crenarchaeota group archaeon SMTZ1-55]
MTTSRYHEVFNIDSLLSRTIQSLFIYILFVGGSVINLDFALMTMAVASITIDIFYAKRDGIFSMNMKKVALNLVFVCVGMALIYVRQPSREEVFTIVVKQGMAEELIFRLGMLGLLRRHLPGDTSLQREAFAALVLNSGLFSLLHHHIFLSLFVLSLVYGYLFLRVGIVSSMVAHALWNLYQSLEALILVVVVIVAYEAVVNYRARKQSFFRWYKRGRATSAAEG